LLSSLEEVPGARRLPVDDKVAHILLFTVLGATLAWTRTAPPGPLRRSPRALVGLGAIYAASDELHQALVPGRTPSLLDWGADIIGVTLGYLVTSALIHRFT
jgi:VanZ family protein